MKSRGREIATGLSGTSEPRSENENEREEISGNNEEMSNFN